MLREPGNPTHSIRRVLALTLLMGLVGLLQIGNTNAQCGGAPDCPVSPMPFMPPLLPPSSTEVDPGGNYFVLGGPPGGQCFAVSGEISGMTMTDIGPISEASLFVNPPFGSMTAPGIDVLSAGVVYPHPMTGTALYCGGSDCMPGFAESFAVTDTSIGSVLGGAMVENALPAGELPLTAAVIATCFGGGHTLNLCVETTAPSIECVSAGALESFPVAAPPVAVPDSYTSGPISGVVVYTADFVYVITGGVQIPVALAGTYVSHVPSAGGVTVTTTQGTQFVPLTAGAVIVPFGTCAAPLDSCPLPSPSPSTISINIAPCPAVDAVAAAWPATGVECELAEGYGRKCPTVAPPGAPPPCAAPFPSFSDEKAKLYGYAKTTLGLPASQNRTVQYWDGDLTPPPAVAAPGQAAPGLPAFLPFVISQGGGDWSFAWPGIWNAAFDFVNCCLDVVDFQMGGNWLVHTQGHRGRFVSRVKLQDPFVPTPEFPDLDVSLELGSGPLMPITIELHPDSVTTRIRDVTTNVVGYTDLYDLTLTATHDTVSTDLDVQFNSNPLLGLTDAQVESDLLAAISYDSAAGWFVVDSTTTVFTATIPVPPATASVELVEDTKIILEHFELGYDGPPPSGFCGDTILDAGEECDPPDSQVCDDSCLAIPAPEDGVTATGTALGGDVTIVINGIMVVFRTVPGESEAETMARLAEAINFNLDLDGAGISALALGDTVVTNGVITQVSTTDAGLSITDPPVAFMSAAIGQVGRDAPLEVRGGCERDAVGEVSPGYPDRYMDAGETVALDVSFAAIGNVSDVLVTLDVVDVDPDSPADCPPGSSGVCADPDRVNNLQNLDVLISGSPKMVPSMTLGVPAIVSFVVQVSDSLVGTPDVEFLITISSPDTLDTLLVNRQTLNVDEVSVFYSTDFPFGGTEFRDYNNNELLENPLVSADPALAGRFEAIVWSDMTAGGKNALVAASAPWNLDANDGGFVSGVGDVTDTASITDNVALWGEDLNFNSILDGEGVCALDPGVTCTSHFDCISSVGGPCRFDEDRDPQNGQLTRNWSTGGGCGWQSSIPGICTGGGAVPCHVDDDCPVGTCSSPVPARGAWHTGRIGGPADPTCLGIGNSPGQCQALETLSGSSGEQVWFELLVTPEIEKVDPLSTAEIVNLAWNMALDLPDDLAQFTWELDNDATNPQSAVDLIGDLEVLGSLRGPFGAVSGIATPGDEYPMFAPTFGLDGLSLNGSLGANRTGNNACYFGGDSWSVPAANKPLFSLAGPPDDDLNNGFCPYDNSVACRAICIGGDLHGSFCNDVSGDTDCPGSPGGDCSPVSPDCAADSCQAATTCVLAGTPCSIDDDCRLCQFDNTMIDEYVFPNGPIRNMDITSAGGPDLVDVLLEDVAGDTGDAFQAAFGFAVFEKRAPEDPDPVAGFGATIDDVVVEWREFTLAEDTTVCTNTPGSATIVDVSKGPLTGDIVVGYQDGCSSLTHNIEYGPLSAVSTYGYSGQACSAVSNDPFNPGPGSFFFVVVSTDGAGIEGSYGRDSDGNERPEDLVDPSCSFTRDLSGRCD